MPRGDTALRPEFRGTRPGMLRGRVPSPVPSSSPVSRLRWSALSSELRFLAASVFYSSLSALVYDPRSVNAQ